METDQIKAKVKCLDGDKFGIREVVFQSASRCACYQVLLI